MKEPIQVGAESFASKAALRRRVQAILKGGGLLDGADDALSRALLARHPHAVAKRGIGVRHVMVRKTLPYGTPCFWIERLDGSGTDFSYIECIAPRTQHDKFAAAARTAIDPQIVAFKAVMPVPHFCPVTAERLDPETAHVDHAPPWTFERILDAFIANGVDVAGADLDGDDDGDCVQRFGDNVLRDGFAKLHLELAELRWVSAKANLSDLRKR